MQTSYKEIFYGIAFGFGAAALDTLIDARQGGETFVSGLADHPGMVLYRLLFILYGLIIGWLLWKNNQRERDMRLLMQQLRRFHHEYEAMAVVLHTNLQMLLTKNLPFSKEAETLLRSTYEKSRDLQSLIRERPSV